MSHWFHQSIVAPGRLPLLFFLVAFVLTFLFIRFSVRMIRAQVTWWPGNVTPGGVHMHHEFFGVILMIVAGFGLIVLARFNTPIADVVFAAVFGIGCALVLDEFALILHLRDVYWAEEGRASVDAIFVALAIGVLFLLGFRPLELASDLADFRSSPELAARVVSLISIGVNVTLAIITLLKGKLWTGIVGMFIPILLIFGAIRVARPRSPWARWQYANRPGRYDKSVARETRYREPLMRWKVVVQEAIAGRFGVPDDPPVLEVARPAAPPTVKAPNMIATAIRWRRTRRKLRVVPTWRLPVILVTLAIIGAGLCTGLDEFAEIKVDSGTLATLLGVIAGAMATLTGLVFTAITLAMQFGAGQISVRVVPMLQQEPVMRWSIGFFLATFAFSIAIAVDLAVGESADSSPALSTAVAFLLAIISAYLFIALVVKVGHILNPAHLLRWIANDGRAAIRRSYPRPTEVATTDTASDGVPAPAPAATLDEPTMQIMQRDRPTQGRVLLAVDLPRLQRYAIKWAVQIDLLVLVGDFVPRGMPVLELRGDARSVRAAALQRCLLFGDTHAPSVSPAAALQAISDIALKSVSSSGNDPSSAVQALDYVEDLLRMLAPRLRSRASAVSADLVSGYGRNWADYVAIGTDEIRRHSRHQMQVQRRLRALYTAVSEQCTADQQTPLAERIAALDADIARDWNSALDLRLAQIPDRQGYGAERGSGVRKHIVSFQAESAPDYGLPESRVSE